MSPATSDRATLHVEDVSLFFGGVAALRDVRLDVQQGETVGVIGPNGAGKTTLINVVAGLVRPTSGRVRIDDADLTRVPAWRRARGLIGRTYQATRIFPALTVREHLRTVVPGEREPLPADTLLELAGLHEHGDRIAGRLTHGDRCLLGVVRALASGPRFLLLDEPAAGLDPGDIERLCGLVGQVRAATGLGLLLVEHNMELVFRLCPRIVVLDQGAVLTTGDRARVEHDPQVLRAYLGSADRVGA
ncbi:MAG: ATP-binding cassette domain-containing protein [Nocardioidaceae bacterium]|nr:ATP-binding cassette domain-containing protein [Nocardioidaceae bacterium]